MHTIKLIYSEQQIKKTIGAYFRNKIGVALPLVTTLVAAFTIYRIIQGDQNWYVGVIGAVVVIAVLLIVSSYFIHIRRSLTRFRKMKSPKALMEVGPDHFRIQSDIGATEMKWEALTQVQCYPLAWLLFFSEGDFLTLPLEGLSEESKQLVLSAAENNGVKIS